MIFTFRTINYLELKNELQYSYSFKTTSDTEVLLAAYIVWGEEMLRRLEGMFAFLIYNTLSGDFIGARDPLGIKPLYYHLDNIRLSNSNSTNN